MYSPQDEGHARLAGHLRNRLGHLLEDVAVNQGLLGRRAVIAPLQILLHLDRNDPGAPHVLDDQRVRDPKDVGAGVFYVLHALLGGQGGVGFLDNVVDIDAQPPLRGQPGAKSRLMR